ncbi:MAG TPA: Rne/Rng family ribonuclease [Actinomadura sp.]|nr:Rne/Rng family ribonuclease [Actinomadura sp.]
MADNDTDITTSDEPGPPPDETAAPAVTSDEDQGESAEVLETPADEETEDAEPELPRFAAPFSSPEPTAVVARPRRRATRPAFAAEPGAAAEGAPAAPAPAFITFVAPAETHVPPAPRRRARRPAADAPDAEAATAAEVDAPPAEARDDDREAAGPRSRRSRSRRRPVEDAEPVNAADDLEAEDIVDISDDSDDAEDRDEGTGAGSRRRRRGRRGRGRGRTGEDEGSGDDETGDDTDEDDDVEGAEDSADADADDSEGGSSTRRRRRRRRRGSSSGDSSGDSTADDTEDDDRPERAGRNGRTTSDDDVRGVAGSTRLEAKRQRRRDGRDTGRRRAPILTESEFLARREAVDRKMVIRQRGERTQIAVLEDDVLVEHYVTQAQSTSFAGNVYLGRVQNVLPSMEAAFVDVGKGRNAVLYAGEVNWDVAGLVGHPRRIESALRSGQSVLVQVTKDPLGHKGARLTSQVSLPGRYLVYVPDGSMTGISRKLPDNERARLKQILKRVMPENAGVIVRTAAEGATEEELARDVSRLAAQWESIQRKAKTVTAPDLLHGEPDLTIRVIRDVFNEDFGEVVVSGDDAWETVEDYVSYVAPHLADRATKWTDSEDVLVSYRIDEQIAKALDRKVWLPSGGSLVIDRTEAMTVVDVNTGKFTGQGGNLEETVTRNNIEAAEEIVRQLRLRDVGGIIVIDFIDMVLESNRDLVLRRLLECLARDRTKHQVAEVTSLGLVQMTRKRVGQGLLDAFSDVCECCNGRGVHVSLTPVDLQPEQDASVGRRRKRKGEVEKAVEKKIAKHDAEKATEETSSEEEAVRADRKHSGRAKAGRSRAAKATVEVVEPVEPVETGAEDAAPVEAVPAARTAEPATDTPAGSDAAVPPALGTPDESGAPESGGSPASSETPEDAGGVETAAGNGRRRRLRRPRAKAEVGSEDGE